MKKIIALITLILFFAGLGYYWKAGQHSGHKNHTSAKQVSKMSYICPMHPHITSDKPGQTCSICGMNLVPADSFNDPEEDEHANQEESTDISMSSEPEGHASIKVNSKKQQLIGVKIGKAKKLKLFKSIKAPGRIAFDPELYTAQSEYLEALKQWTRVKDSPLTDVKRSTDEMIKSAKIRLRVLGLSNDQIKRLARRGSQSEGLLVSGKGQESWVYADVFEVDLPQIKKGLSAEISANFLKGKTLVGKVLSVDQVIDSKTRTAKVRIQLHNTDVHIRPESYVNVNIFAPQGEHLSVPVEALMDTGRETFVFVKSGKGQFDPRRVTVLLETDNQVAIGSGLKEGDEIVIGGNFMLDSESRLKSVLRGSSSHNEHNH